MRRQEVESLFQDLEYPEGFNWEPSCEERRCWRGALDLAAPLWRRHARPEHRQGLEALRLLQGDIPTLGELDQKLRTIHWRLLPIQGFIPFRAFLQFAAARILPTSIGVRSEASLAHAVEPDYFHEVMGHAAQLFDPEYRALQELYGQIASQAEIREEDQLLDAAQRRVFDLEKGLIQDRDETQLRIELEYSRHQVASLKSRFFARGVPVSEAQELSRFGWYTFEYGLISDGRGVAQGRLQLFGALLLSSPAQAKRVLSGEVAVNRLTEGVVEEPIDLIGSPDRVFVADSLPEVREILLNVAGRQDRQRRARVSRLRRLRRKRAGRTLAHLSA